MKSQYWITLGTVATLGLFSIPFALAPNFLQSREPIARAKAIELINLIDPAAGPTFVKSSPALINGGQPTFWVIDFKTSRNDTYSAFYKSEFGMVVSLKSSRNYDRDRKLHRTGERAFLSSEIARAYVLSLPYVTGLPANLKLKSFSFQNDSGSGPKVRPGIISATFAYFFGNREVLMATGFSISIDPQDRALLRFNSGRRLALTLDSNATTISESNARQRLKQHLIANGHQFNSGNSSGFDNIHSQIVLVKVPGQNLVVQAHRFKYGKTEAVLRASNGDVLFAGTKK